MQPSTIKNGNSTTASLFHRWKQNPHNEEYLKKFRELRDNFELAVKKSKKKFYWDKFKACIGDSRQTYKLLNDLRGSSSDAQTVPALTSCLQRQSEPTAEDTADKFNHYFTTIAKDIKAALPETALPVLPSVEKSMFLYEVSNAEVKLIIDQLDNQSSSGDDNVNNLIVKASVPVVIR